MTSDKQETAMGGSHALTEIVERVQQISAENEKLVRRLADGESRFRRLAKAVWRVQEEERRRIALELHDGLGQVLTALINHMNHAGNNGHGTDDAAVELASSALTEVRRMSRALRPSVLDDLGLDAGLCWLVRTTSESSDIVVDLDWHYEDMSLDTESETLIFRIVQEALTNVIRHSEATRAKVTIEHIGERVQVVIADNGRGFDARETLVSCEKGFGARGMRDRAELFGGRLHIDSAPNEGTTVTLLLPENGS